MKLVDDWKDAWRWWSMRGLALIAVLPVIWMELPPDLKDIIPIEWRPWILSIIAIATAIGRMTPQRKQ